MIFTNRTSCGKRPRNWTPPKEGGCAELAGNREGPCRPLEGEERTEVPSEANTVDADLVSEKAKSYAPMRRGPLTSAFSGRGDNIGIK